MEQFGIVEILLAIISILLLFIFLKLNSFLNQMQINKKIEYMYNDDHLKQRGDMFQQQKEYLELISSDIEKVKSDLEDMKYVSDIFYKYKLPDQRERDVLDQVSIDNEVFDGIANAGRHRT
jgi:hypothetical protein